jgi:predicted nucleic acid-binding protein
MKRKVLTVLMDASSAIILYKANLHHIVPELYNVVISRSVYDEITNNSYPGAIEYQQLVADNNIMVQTPPVAEVNKLLPSGLHRLEQGEHDIVLLYYAGYGDFILTDDGVAAKYCKSKGVPFINSLLVPVIIKCSGNKSDTYCQAAFDSIVHIGRYSEWVIHFAERCERDELTYFLP